MAESCVVATIDLAGEREVRSPPMDSDWAKVLLGLLAFGPFEIEPSSVRRVSVELGVCLVAFAVLVWSTPEFVTGLMHDPEADLICREIASSPLFRVRSARIEEVP